MTVEVRPATLRDEDRVFELLVQLLGPDLARSADARTVFRGLIADNSRGSALVAVEDEMVLGVITVSFNPAIRYGGLYAQVEELVVDENARGKHVGAALVRAAIDAARARGCREIGLYPLEGNRPFYEKFGFTYVGEELRQPL